MGQIRVPRKAKLFTGIISTSHDLIDATREILPRHLGEIDFQSDIISFDFTDYYQDEMGSNLLRTFFSFVELVQKETLKEIKHLTNKIEGSFAVREGEKIFRKVNIDPGYVDSSRIVLATTKDYSHRIYLGNGIYGEVTLIFKNKKFNPLEWTYPDYRINSTLEFFLKMRAKYMKQIQDIQEN